MRVAAENVLHKNIELWAQTDPKHALMLPYHHFPFLQFCKTDLNETNLRTKSKERWRYFHAQIGAVQEAQIWFNSLDLQDVAVLVVFGIGLGYYYEAAAQWLKENSKRKIVFLENDLGVIYRFFETNLATDMLSNPQVQILFFQDLKDNEAIFETLYWNFSMQRLLVSALKYYESAQKKMYTQLSRKITYDFAVKNALVDEYLRFGGPFFVNFYQNILNLPTSYLGNKTFGSFKQVPAIICGAGPSLAKSLPLLASLKQKALIFAGGSAMNALNAYGIVPHLGAGIDPNPAQFVRLSSNQAFEVPYYYRNRLHHEAFKTIRGPRLYITGSGGYDVAEYFEEKLDIKHEFLDEGHNVVNFCLQIAQQLGCHPVIFVGMDLAFTGMKAYAPGVEDNVEFDPNQFAQAAEIDERPLLLKDTDGKPIYTLWKWVAEADWISEFSKEYPDIMIVNATEGGIGFPDIPNLSLAEAAGRYLIRDYAIQDRLHGEIQNSRMPDVTMFKMDKLMQELRDSLQRCVGYFNILIKDLEALKTQPEHFLQSGQAALAETELADEDGYKYVLDIFNAVQSRLQNQALHELKNVSENDRHYKKNEIIITRLLFLRDVATINIGLIDRALDAKKNEKMVQTSATQSLPDPTLPPSPLADFQPVLLPKNPVEGQNGEGGRIVTMLREYGKPPEEIRLEYQGELEGQCLSYYSNRQLKGEVFYKRGVLHGPSTIYSQTGSLLAKSWFVNGKQEGECKWFYLSGAVYSIQRFKNGIWHGLQEYYYEDGSLKTLVEYKEGHLAGLPTLN